MRNAFVIHGMPDKDEYLDPQTASPGNSHWLPWLRQQLQEAGIEAPLVELPTPYEPEYAKWKESFEHFVPEIGADTMLVGHSAGAAFIVRWLGEKRINVNRVALVAPYLDPNREEYGSNLYDYDIPAWLVTDTKGMCVFYSTDDDPEILDSVEILKERIPGIEVQEFANRGHFTLQDMGTNEFPELRDWLLNKA